MKGKMLVCGSCRTYTFEPECPSCGARTVKPAPCRYSPQDKYGKYRRMMKAARDNGGKEKGADE